MCGRRENALSVYSAAELPVEAFRKQWPDGAQNGSLFRMKPRVWRVNGRFGAAARHAGARS